MIKRIHWFYHLLSLLLTGFALLFFGVFILDLYPEWGINRNPSLAANKALLINMALLLLFGLQHSVMARTSFKSRLKKWIPANLERTSFNFISALALIILLYFWQGIDGQVWYFGGPASRAIMYFFFGLGLFFTAMGIWSIKGADLLGHIQFKHGEHQNEVPFQAPFIYRVVRHPIYFGTLTILWAHPVLTFSRFLFALGLTAYMLIGIYYEEKDLLRRYGKAYRFYQSRVPMLIPGIQI
ncbi:MAG: isoprenylcysteine carboxylmethyltransferase family protein [Bacteroidetes bacterium]|nr:isoprenylcysteine carboxylmethyltransferase family protein [Bacteroidota bacterium]